MAPPAPTPSPRRTGAASRSRSPRRSPSREHLRKPTRADHLLARQRSSDALIRHNARVAARGRSARVRETAAAPEPPRATPARAPKAEQVVQSVKAEGDAWVRSPAPTPPSPPPGPRPPPANARAAVVGRSARVRETPTAPEPPRATPARAPKAEQVVQSVKAKEDAWVRSPAPSPPSPPPAPRPPPPTAAPAVSAADAAATASMPPLAWWPMVRLQSPFMQPICAFMAVQTETMRQLTTCETAGAAVATAAMPPLAWWPMVRLQSPFMQPFCAFMAVQTETMRQTLAVQAGPEAVKAVDEVARSVGLVLD